MNMPDNNRSDTKTAIHIKVEGIVQGVGFRPFLHRLARKYKTGGWVRNTSYGLEGYLTAEAAALKCFLAELENSPPPMAQIDRVTAEEIALKESSKKISPHSTPEGFSILESRTGSGSTLIAPDTAMCPDCEAELCTPSDRRYRYPFINCTNCGPRYTIIEALPYDRERTVMREFSMCHECSGEYHDLADRRYHAQPDCCPDCGPRVFYSASGQDLHSDADRNSSTEESDDAFRAAQRLLADGGILAVKGIGGIHLACSALDPSAVTKLRERKHRAEKPLAIMCRSLEAVRRICEVTPEEEALLTSPARPIVLLAKKDPGSLRDLSFSRRLGVMLPYSPLHALLLDGVYGGPDILVMTSGNVSGCPVLTDNESAVAALGDTADGFLLHNRRIANRCDDSLIAEWKGQPYFLRRSRGYAPAPFSIGKNAGGICALGAEQKASFALGRDAHVFLSPYIGDLKNAETFEHYTGAMLTYRKLFGIEPSLYVCDLHPDYLSTQETKRLSRTEGIPLLKVQHHFAHMASCMADNGLDTECFGIIWDGTGLGTDGTIWGGEFLTGDLTGFKRAGSIRPVSLPGGDRAVQEISRIALALYDDAFGDDGDPLKYVPLEKDRCDMLKGLLRTSFSPSASSIGRLFDGVCSLILQRGAVDYEGEGAALVEALSPAETPEELETPLEALSCPFDFYMRDNVRIFDTRPMIRELIRDLDARTDAGQIALRFMSTLICMAADQCRVLNPRKLPVLLSGGVFQNRFLLHGLVSALEADGFTVYTHHRVSANDEGICLGQLAVAQKKRSIDHVFSNADENSFD